MIIEGEKNRLGIQKTLTLSGSKTGIFVENWRYL